MNKKFIDKMEDFEIGALKAWLLFLTCFEMVEIYKYLVRNVPFDGFFSTLKNERPEKRLWSMVLVFLMLARLQAAFYMNSPGVLAHNATVHILEAVVFGYEKIIHGGNADNGVFAIILMNAIWFLSAAMRINTI